jgi:hypothetical protein
MVSRTAEILVMITVSVKQRFGLQKISGKLSSARLNTTVMNSFVDLFLGTVYVVFAQCYGKLFAKEIRKFNSNPDMVVIGLSDGSTWSEVSRRFQGGCEQR